MSNFKVMELEQLYINECENMFLYFLRVKQVIPKVLYIYTYIYLFYFINSNRMNPITIFILTITFVK